MISISEMKSKAGRIDLTNPVIVTQNGLPTMVITSYDDYVKERDLLSTLIILVNSSTSNTIPSKEFQTRLEKRKQDVQK